MDQKGYILSLHTQKSFEKQLGKEVIRNILYSFVTRPKPTVYDCHKDLNMRYVNYNRKIDYKNVHRRVKLLYSHNLIRRIKIKENEKPIHNKVRYKLTSLGLFYMYFYEITNSSELISNYSQNDLYKIFLYPYMELKTVESLTDESLKHEINRYLTKCCQTIDEVYLKNLKEIKETGGLDRQITLISTLTDSLYSEHKSLGSKAFIQYLLDKREIKWLKVESSIIQKIKKNRLIKIIEGKNELLLKIDTSNLQAKLHESDVELFSFGLKKFGKNDYVITEGRRSIEIENFLTINVPSFEFFIKQNITEFCPKILEQNAKFHYGNMKKKNDILLTNKILKKDQSLVRMIDNFKSEIDNYYEEFINKR